MCGQTRLLWANPSPNMRSPTEALPYSGVALLEFANLARQGNRHAV